MSDDVKDLGELLKASPGGRIEHHREPVSSDDIIDTLAGAAQYIRSAELPFRYELPEPVQTPFKGVRVERDITNESEIIETRLIKDNN